MIFLAIGLALQMSSPQQPTLIPSHKHVMGPVPTKVQHAESVSCPAGDLQVVVTEQYALPKDRVKLTKISLNGVDLQSDTISAARFSMSRFSALRSVEVGCFSDEEFNVYITGSSLKSTNIQQAFVVGKTGVLVVPEPG